MEQSTRLFKNLFHKSFTWLHSGLLVSLVFSFLFLSFFFFPCVACLLVCVCVRAGLGFSTSVPNLEQAWPLSALFRAGCAAQLSVESLPCLAYQRGRQLFNVVMDQPQYWRIVKVDLPLNLVLPGTEFTVLPAEASMKPSKSTGYTWKILKN